MTQVATPNAAGAEARLSAERDLEPLFAPRSVAVVGASRTPGAVGNAIMQNMIDAGFTGVLYPVNPKARSIFANPCTPSIGAIPEPVDLAVLVIPSPLIEKAVIEAADHGTRHFVVISAGFKEIGGEGLERELRIKRLARERGLNIIGPNCLGVINTAPEVGLNASFSRDTPRAGALGLISQSGALCTALLDYAKGRGIGFSRFVSFGNKVDVTEIDLMYALASDPKTRVILMYVEDISDGQRFIRAAHEISHGPNPKPIVVIKTGRTAQGAAAAASHTGSLAGSDEVYDAMMRQAGVIRVESVQDLFDYAECFADPVLPTGKRVAIVTNAGGPGIMATDACIRSGLELAKFQEYTQKSLKFQLPPTASIKNPVDVIGDAKHDRYRSALDAVSADENVDQIVIIITPQMMTDLKEIAEVIAETRSFVNKPVIACPMGLVDVSPAVELLHRHGIPTYTFPENAMRAISAKSEFARWVRTPIEPSAEFAMDDAAIDEIIAGELAAGRSHLIEVKALEVFRHCQFPVADYRLAANADEAVAAADAMGYPVVLKIVGPEILHKTDVGGVVLKLQDADAVRTAFDEMVARVRGHLGAEVEIWGTLVQKMLKKGKEIILGMTRDPAFGPMLMFGLGGIYTEALRDVQFRLAPLRPNDAAGMITGIRSHKLLEGVRGEPASDVDAIAECLQRLSQLVTKHPQIKELDVNPLIVYPSGQGAIAADARIILTQPEN